MYIRAKRNRTFSPSSKRIYKHNSNRETGAKIGHTGHSRKGFTETEADRIVYIDPDGETCRYEGKFAVGQKVQHSVYKYIPADNNFAEREHRKVVINRKISFGSQAEQGLATREVLMSIMHTVAAEGCNP